MQAKGEPLTGQKIRDVVTVNGVRVTVEDGTWGLVRASSNKPELVVVVESPVSEARMREMFDGGRWRAAGERGGRSLQSDDLSCASAKGSAGAHNSCVAFLDETSGPSGGGRSKTSDSSSDVRKREPEPEVEGRRGNVAAKPRRRARSWIAAHKLVAALIVIVALAAAAAGGVHGG